jgi:hypothetical protein
MFVTFLDMRLLAHGSVPVAEVLKFVFDLVTVMLVQESENS